MIEIWCSAFVFLVTQTYQTLELLNAMGSYARILVLDILSDISTVQGTAAWGRQGEDDKVFQTSESTKTLERPLDRLAEAELDPSLLPLNCSNGFNLKGARGAFGAFSFKDS